MIPLAKDVVTRALRTPYANLRDRALSDVSLSHDEIRCVIGCVVDGYTNEELAEMIERSPKFVSRHRTEGLHRIAAAWAKLDADMIAEMIDY